MSETLMEGEYLLQLVLRWLHIVSAALAIGVPIYVRFVLMPAMSHIDESQRSAFRDALNSRWRLFVSLMIVVFLVTGFWTYLGIARWRDFPPEARPRYHMLFGIKVLLALGMFFISSALAGRSTALAGMRTSAKLWVGVLIALALVIVAISGVMRLMPPSTI